jgi:spermidine/putrescine transport system permease protein
VSGGDPTFPLFVWGISRVSVPPQVNVVASAIFLLAMLLMLANILVQRRRELKGTP